MSDLNVYTTSAINALTPITGDMVVDSDLNAIKLYDGSAWRTWNSDSTAVPYQNRWGANFDGSDILTCGSVSELNSASDAAISCWFNASSFPATYNTLWGGGALSNAGRFWFNCTQSRFRLYNGSTYSNFSTSLSVGTWYHVVVVISGTTNLSVYLNGSQLGSTVTFPALQSTAGDDFQIGSVPIYPTLFLWNGKIDDVSIFNSALSAADITKIYNGTAPNGVPTDLTKATSYDTDRTANLKGYWRMGDDSNDSATSGGNIATITDSSGNGNDATQSTASSQPTFSDLTGETIYV